MKIGQDVHTSYEKQKEHDTKWATYLAHLIRDNISCPNCSQPLSASLSINADLSCICGNKYIMVNNKLERIDNGFSNEEN